MIEGLSVLAILVLVPLLFYLLSRCVDRLGGVTADTDMPPWYSAFDGPFLGKRGDAIRSLLEP